MTVEECWSGFHYKALWCHVSFKTTACVTLIRILYFKLKKYILLVYLINAINEVCLVMWARQMPKIIYCFK